MKATFETEDPKEILQLTLSSNMAHFIWELVHNGWREFKHTDYDYQPAWEKINEMLNEYGINTEELI